MKFGKKYSSFVETEAQTLLPKCSYYVEFKRLKKLLKKCPLHELSSAPSSSTQDECQIAAGIDTNGESAGETSTTVVLHTKQSSCSACDAQFFPDLLKTVSAVVDCFNAAAQDLLHIHLASGLTKYYLRLKTKIARNQTDLSELGNILVCYGCMNALAVRKILKKYDKVHGTLNGRKFKTRLQGLRAELLQSPWLIELGALAVNLMESKVPRSLVPPGRVEYAACTFDRSKHTLTCVLPDAIRLDFSLTCPICLDIVFDPVALGCGHIFCTSCVCEAASVPAFQGAKAAKRRSKCPLCRQTGVYPDSVLLRELAVLISTRCADYYHDRLQLERQQRLKEAKEHWDREAAALLGF